MKSDLTTLTRLTLAHRGVWLLLCALALLSTAIAFAQWPVPGNPFPAPTTPDFQRNALGEVRSQINWLLNATRTASNFGANGYGNLWGQFQAVRNAYNTFKQSLNPRQLGEGANSFAELDAGLDIIQEAFTNYQNDVAAGRAANLALRDLCQVLREASQMWLQEFNKDCSRLRVGWQS